MNHDGSGHGRTEQGRGSPPAAHSHHGEQTHYRRTKNKAHNVAGRGAGQDGRTGAETAEDGQPHQSQQHVQAHGGGAATKSKDQSAEDHH